MNNKKSPLKCEETVHCRIIDAYLKRFHERLSAEDKQDSSIFPSDFYNRLVETNVNVFASNPKKCSEYDKKNVKKLIESIRSINVFDKNSVFMPILEDGHWYLAVIRGLKNFDPNMQSDNIQFLFFNSLRSREFNHEALKPLLTSFLEFLYSCRKQKKCRFDPITEAWPIIPQQKSSHYSLFYILQCIKSYFTHPVDEQEDMENWFSRDDVVSVGKSLKKFAAQQQTNLYIHPKVNMSTKNKLVPGTTIRCQHCGHMSHYITSCEKCMRPHIEPHITCQSRDFDAKQSIAKCQFLQQLLPDVTSPSQLFYPRRPRLTIKKGHVLKGKKFEPGSSKEEPDLSGEDQKTSTQETRMNGHTSKSDPSSSLQGDTSRTKKNSAETKNSNMVASHVPSPPSSPPAAESTSSRSSIHEDEAAEMDTGSQNPEPAGSEVPTEVEDSPETQADVPTSPVKTRSKRKQSLLKKNLEPETLEISDVEETENQKSEDQQPHNDTSLLFTFLYPSTNSATRDTSQRGVTILLTDYHCLRPGEMLNDSVIEFYLRYLQHNVLSEVDKNRTHIFSSYFYQSLTKLPANHPDPSDIMYSNVKNWTKGVDIFEKDFVVVPVNRALHWILAIICFPGLKSCEPMNDDGTAVSPQSEVPVKQPCIIIFDSMSPHVWTKEVAEQLLAYLQFEYQTRKSHTRDFSKVLTIYPEVPQQSNAVDCGVFVLQYAKSFFQNPIKSFKENLPLEKWFSARDIRGMRKEIALVIQCEWAKTNSLVPKLPVLFPENREKTAPCKTDVKSKTPEVEKKEKQTNVSATGNQQKKKAMNFSEKLSSLSLKSLRENGVGRNSQPSSAKPVEPKQNSGTDCATSKPTSGSKLDTELHSPNAASLTTPPKPKYRIFKSKSDPTRLNANGYSKFVVAEVCLKPVASPQKSVQSRTTSQSSSSLSISSQPFAHRNESKSWLESTLQQAQSDEDEPANKARKIEMEIVEESSSDQEMKTSSNDDSKKRPSTSKASLFPEHSMSDQKSKTSSNDDSKKRPSTSKASLLPEHSVSSQELKKSSNDDSKKRPSTSKASLLPEHSVSSQELKKSSNDDSKKRPSTSQASLLPKKITIYVSESDIATDEEAIIKRPKKSKKLVENQEHESMNNTSQADSAKGVSKKVTDSKKSEAHSSAENLKLEMRKRLNKTLTQEEPGYVDAIFESKSRNTSSEDFASNVTLRKRKKPKKMKSPEESEQDDFKLPESMKDELRRKSKKYIKFLDSSPTSKESEDSYLKVANKKRNNSLSSKQCIEESSSVQDESETDEKVADSSPVCTPRSVKKERTQKGKSSSKHSKEEPNSQSDESETEEEAADTESDDDGEIKKEKSSSPECIEESNSQSNESEIGEEAADTPPKCTESDAKEETKKGKRLLPSKHYTESDESETVEKVADLSPVCTPKSGKEGKTKRGKNSSKHYKEESAPQLDESEIDEKEADSADLSPACTPKSVKKGKTKRGKISSKHYKEESAPQLDEKVADSSPACTPKSGKEGKTKKRKSSSKHCQEESSSQSDESEIYETAADSSPVRTPKSVKKGKTKKRKRSSKHCLEESSSQSDESEIDEKAAASTPKCMPQSDNAQKKGSLTIKKRNFFQKFVNKASSKISKSEISETNLKTKVNKRGSVSTEKSTSNSSVHKKRTKSVSYAAKKMKISDQDCQSDTEVEDSYSSEKASSEFRGRNSKETRRRNSAAQKKNMAQKSRLRVSPRNFVSASDTPDSAMSSNSSRSTVQLRPRSKK